MMIRRVTTIAKKEAIDNVRDRRTLFTALLFPLFGPAMLGTMVVLTGNLVGGAKDEPIGLPVSGTEHAPKLVAFLEQNHVLLRPAPTDPERAVREGHEEMVLVIASSFGRDLSLGRPAPLQLFFDQSDRASAPLVARTRGLLERYGAQLGALRLLARGVDPSLTHAIVVQSVDVSTPEARGLFLLGIMPLFVVLSVFIGGMHLAIDTTAGERERGSLEALLINPVSRAEVVFGKLLATWMFTVVSLLTTLIAFLLMGALLPGGPLARLGIHLRLDVVVVFDILLVAFPLTFFGAAVQMNVAAFCRSFKEAQTYVSLVMMLPVVPALILVMLPVQEKPWMMLIPTVGEQLAVLGILRQEPLGALFRGLSLVSTLGISLLLGVTAAGLYKRERILSQPAA